LQELDFF